MKWSGVARYFFSLHDRSGDLPDEEGCDLSGTTAMQAYAVTVARSLMADDIRNGHLNLSDYLEVSNDSGEIVHMLPFASAVTIDP